MARKIYITNPWAVYRRDGTFPNISLSRFDFLKVKSENFRFSWFYLGCEIWKILKIPIVSPYQSTKTSITGNMSNINEPHEVSCFLYFWNITSKYIITWTNWPCINRFSFILPGRYYRFDDCIFVHPGMRSSLFMTKQ